MRSQVTSLQFVPIIGVPGAGFIGVDEIRMLLKKIFTLILHFNFLSILYWSSKLITVL